MTDGLGREYIVGMKDGTDDSELMIFRRYRLDAPPVITRTDVYTGKTESGESISKPNAELEDGDIQETDDDPLPLLSGGFNAADCEKILKENELDSIPKHWAISLNEILVEVRKNATMGSRGTIHLIDIEFDKAFFKDSGLPNPNTRFGAKWDWIFRELKNRGFKVRAECLSNMFTKALTSVIVTW